MSFDPQVSQEIEFNGKLYRFAQHPYTVAGIPYGQEGKAAVVYKLDAPDDPMALKVFKPRFCSPNQASLATRLAPFASFPGLTVCRRTVLTPQRHASLLRQYPDLMYTVLMPWIEGPTWMQVLQEKTSLTAQQSHLLAQSLAQILSEMEQQGIAHGDLSAPNLLLPVLSPNGQGKSYAPIELVDVEQMYAKGLDRPEIIPSGSEGYAHKTVRQEKIWDDRVDRFAGAILIAEMLGWSDEKVREAAWGESYFDPQELQRASKRYTLLRSSLQNHWGDEAVTLLDRAWNSEILADCPTFGSWLIALPESVGDQTVAQAPLQPDPDIAYKSSQSGLKTAYSSTQSDITQTDLTKTDLPAVPPPPLVEHPDRNAQPAKPGEDPTVAMLIDLGGELAAQGNLAAARETYQKALSLVPPGSAEAQAILVLMHLIEGEAPQNSDTTLAAGDTTITEPVSEGGTLPKNNGPVNPDIDRPQRKNFLDTIRWEWLLGAMVVIGVIVFAVLISNQSTSTGPTGSPAVQAPLISQPSHSTFVYFVSNRDGKREIYRLEGSKTTRVTNSPARSESWDPFFVPSGSLYFTSNRAGKREIYRLDGSKTVRVTNTPGGGESWDPFFTESSSLYFTSTREGKREIYRLEGSKTVRVTNTPGSDESWDPFFTRNSNLYFTSTRNGKMEIYRLEGNKTVRVTNTPGIGQSFDPFFISSGALYFTSNREGKREIYRMEGSKTVRVTNTSGGSESWGPFFTPFSEVYFTSNREGKEEIFRLNGSKTVQVTHTSGNGESWGPFFR